MTAPTDQFVDIAKRSQEAVTTAVRTWADSFQSLTGNLTGAQSQLPDAQSVVDTYFDFVEQVLANQRRLAHQFVAASLKAGESVQGQVAKVAEKATTQTVNGTEAAADQATDLVTDTSIKAATTARAARNIAKS